MDVGTTASLAVSLAACPRPDPLEHASVSVPVAPDSVPPVAVRLEAVSPSSRGPALFWRVVGQRRGADRGVRDHRDRLLSERDDVALARARDPGRRHGRDARAQPAAAATRVRAAARADGVARQIDPLDPGPRVQVTRRVRCQRPRAAFNEMLDRLEAERRQSAGRPSLRRRASGCASRRSCTTRSARRSRRCAADRAPRGDVPDALRDVLEAQETARGEPRGCAPHRRPLRPEALDELGLQSALSSWPRVSEHAGLRWSAISSPASRSPRSEELVIYRVAQEALTNVARHARCDLCRAAPRLAQRTVSCGRRRRPRAAADARDGGGIHGMRERAMLIGARLTITRPRAAGPSGPPAAGRA